MPINKAKVSEVSQEKVTNLINDLTSKASLTNPIFTKAPVLSSEGITFTDGSQTKEGVASRTTIVKKAASYTLSSLNERDCLIEMGSTLPVTVTIPTDQALNYPIGTSIDVLQTNSGQVTIQTSGITSGQFGSGGAQTSVTFNLATINYDVKVGQLVSGTGIPAGTLVVGVNGPSIVIDTPASAQISGTITFSVGLVYTPGPKLRTKWSSATLFKRAANSWILFGDLTA